MMLTLIAAAAVAGTAQSQPSPAALVGRMFEHYFRANTLTGTITMVQTAGGVRITCATTLQFEKPAKLYIRQEFRGDEQRLGLVTSDGVHFTYNAPPDLPDAARVPRLRERVSTEFGRLDLGQIYAASSEALPDRSVVLDIAIGRREHLEFRRDQWATLVYAGRKTIDGTAVHHITGRYRAYRDADLSGTFDLYITDTNDLKRYVLRTNVTVNRQVVPVVAQWDANLRVNGRPDASLFRVVS